MGTWGPGNFENDAALDFVGDEIDRHVRAIYEVFADHQRFRLDEDAEGEVLPRIAILSFLCEHCGGILAKDVDAVAWKARYLEMYDGMIDEMAPDADYKEQRRAVIVATFDKLIGLST
ncbi:MAG TPA: DUF4259 domain-containing protein [Ktedonobacterales bacterium]|nr:DUF4259 domain-containing protein [Ktedonobacterales bacterium]